jgi:hypothetical protein
MVLSLRDQVVNGPFTHTRPDDLVTGVMQVARGDYVAGRATRQLVELVSPAFAGALVSSEFEPAASASPLAEVASDVASLA